MFRALDGIDEWPAKSRSLIAEHLYRRDDPVLGVLRETPVPVLEVVCELDFPTHLGTIALA
jgi:hypothetical protein